MTGSIDKTIMALKELEGEIDKWDGIIIFLTYSRLDPETRLEVISFSLHGSLPQ